MTLLRENSNERGKNILSCVYSRLVKTGADIAKSATSPLCDVVKTSCETLFQSWWAWLEPILTSLEAQFVKAKQFDLERYSAMLKQGERKIRALYNLGNMSKSSITASFSQVKWGHDPQHFSAHCGHYKVVFGKNRPKF